MSDDDPTALPPGPWAAPPPMPPPAGVPGFGPTATGPPTVPGPTGTGPPAPGPTTPGPPDTGPPLPPPSPPGPGPAAPPPRRRGPWIIAGAVVAAAAVVAIVLGTTGHGSSPRPATIGSPPDPRPATTAPAPAATTPETVAPPPPSPGRVATAAQVAGALRLLDRIPLSDLSRSARTAILTGDASTPHQALLRRGGLPEILFLGNHASPFSAAERWPLVVALSQFGRFSGGRATLSSGVMYVGVSSFLFEHLRYTSPYVSFRAIELHYLRGRPVVAPGPMEREQWLRADPARTVPFVDIGGRFALTQAQFLPSVLGHRSLPAVTRAVAGGHSPLATDVRGAAEVLVYQICQVTHGRPGRVCDGLAGPRHH